MRDLIRTYARPKLNQPNLLAVWPGVGNVAMIIATYLSTKLNLKELAEINPSVFFDPTGVLVQDSIIEAPQFPPEQVLLQEERQKERQRPDLVCRGRSTRE